MRNIFIFFAVLLSGCAMDSYRPQVAQPQDEIYERDLKDCIQYSKETRSKPDLPKSAIIGATGLLGYAVLAETKDPKDPYFKDGYELTNECLTSKGYDLK